MNQLTINYDTCIGCKSCYKSCFVDVFRWNVIEKRPVVAYPEDCVNCCFCLAECPVGAITLETDYSRDWEAIPGDSQPVDPDFSGIPFAVRRKEDSHES